MIKRGPALTTIIQIITIIQIYTVKAISPEICQCYETPLCHKPRFRCIDGPNETPGSNQCFLTVCDWKAYWNASTRKINSLFCYVVVILSMHWHCTSQDAFNIKKNAKILLLLANILHHCRFFVVVLQEIILME